MTMMWPRVLLMLLAVVLLPLRAPAFAQERPTAPYFVTYDHHLEELDALEIENVWVPGHADGINPFLANWTEFEFGVREWWTTAFYIDWQHTAHDSSVFTGVRSENRLRLRPGQHLINPVLYVEYEHLNEADKILKEIVGFDSKDDLAVPNHQARREHARELELKMILSSDFGPWNVSENFTTEKNLHEGRWEFGYAVGVSRPLAPASGRDCTFCAERFAAGVEVYGGLGEWRDFGFDGTSHYIAPLVSWLAPSETLIRVSSEWGLTDASVGRMFRIGVSQDVDHFGKRVKGLFSR